MIEAAIVGLAVFAVLGWLLAFVEGKAKNDAKAEGAHWKIRAGEARTERDEAHARATRAESSLARVRRALEAPPPPAGFAQDDIQRCIQEQTNMLAGAQLNAVYPGQPARTGQL